MIDCQFVIELCGLVRGGIIIKLVDEVAFGDYRKRSQIAKHFQRRQSSFHKEESAIEDPAVNEAHRRSTSDNIQR